MSKPSLFVVAYDVTEDKRRGRVRKLLREYGEPVQRSVFEARLTRRERERLLARAERLVDLTTDSLVLYPIAPRSEAGIVALGQPRPEIRAPRFFIV